MRSVYETLEQRGFIAQVAGEGIAEHLAKEKIAVYAGFDPTADSLHLGHLVPVLALGHFQRAGHRPIAVVGGATGMVGDPSGKSEERKLLSRDEIVHNVACVKKQMERFFSFEGDNPALVLDNHDWIGSMSFIDWLRDVGKHFTVNSMLAKESVKSRLGAEGGISYTEFSYMTMQAYDFLHLYERRGCTLQVGGSDQWGNITAGIDLIRRKRAARAYGITFPLVATSSGEKFGKTAGNAVWLDADRTRPYQLYQYWIQCDDRDVGPYLKLFTFLPLEEIAAIVAEHEKAPHKRDGQRRLAEDFTRRVHGEDGLARAQQATQALFGGEIAGLSERDLLDIFADVPSTALSKDRLGAGLPVVDLFAEAGACPSKSAARRLVAEGGAYVNNERVTDRDKVVTAEDLASETVMILRTGKKKHYLVRFE